MLVVGDHRLLHRCTHHPEAKTCAYIFNRRSLYGALGGLLAEAQIGLPWIAEIHDPMIFPGITKNRMRMRFSAWLEGKICKHADVVWWFTEVALARARARHPEPVSYTHLTLPTIYSV